LDCKEATINGYDGLNCYINLKGHLSLYETTCCDFDTNYKRTAEYVLGNGELQLSRIYIEDLDFPQYGFGFPDGNELLNNGTSNPMYDFRDDGYLFHVNKDHSIIEVFIVRDGRHLITQYLQQMIDGLLDDEIISLKSYAITFYDYDHPVDPEKMDFSHLDEDGRYDIENLIAVEDKVHRLIVSKLVVDGRIDEDEIIS